MKIQETTLLVTWLLLLSSVPGLIAAGTQSNNQGLPAHKQKEVSLQDGSTAGTLSPASGSELSESTPRDTSTSTLEKPGATRTSSHFEVAVHEVLVPVAVTDREGHLVSGLGLEDFRLSEDGVEQELETLLAEEASLTVGIVVDLSRSMKEKMESMQLALSKFLDCLKPQDRAFVLAFNQFVLPVQSLTSDQSMLRESLSRMEPGGGTALFDGIVEGAYLLHQSQARKRALVVLSDGIDNSSVNSARDAISAAKATGIPIYTIGIGKMRKGFFAKAFSDPVRREFREMNDICLRKLAARTAGRALFVAEMKRKGVDPSRVLGEAFERVARELRSLYLLSYQPKRGEMDGRWHNIQVRVLRPDLYTRFRPGYLAAEIR